MMKIKYIKSIALSAFSIFTGLTLSHAQSTPFLQFGGKPARDTVNSTKMNAWDKLTKTPWVINIGPSIVDDDDAKLSAFKVRSDNNMYPVFTSAEKRIKGKWGVQVAVSSESLSPHNYWATDFHVKYSFLTASIEEYSFFDPYALAGLGHSYRDFPVVGYRYDSGFDNSLNANIGAGANFWIFPNAAIFVQTIGKFVLLQKELGGSNHIQYTAGLAFKIGGKKAGKVDDIILPPHICPKDATDADAFLRNIMNNK